MLNIKGNPGIHKKGGYFLFTECKGLKYFQCNLERKWHQASRNEGNLIHLLKRRKPTMWHEISLRFSHLCIMLRKVMWSSSSVLSFAAQKAHLLTAPEEKASFIIPRQVFQDTRWKVWPNLSTCFQTQQLRQPPAFGSWGQVVLS